jgi:hypothetical protein
MPKLEYVNADSVRQACFDDLFGVSIDRRSSTGWRNREAAKP